MTHRTLLVTLVVALSLGSCASHTTARRWNGVTGADGEPTFYTTTKRPAIRLFVVIPFLGNPDVDGMVDDLTAYVASKGGDHVRLVQGDTENYWFAFPPLTWVLTPVVARVDAEWRPSPEHLAEHEHDWLGVEEDAWWE